MIYNQGVQRTRDNSKYAFAWDTVSMPNEGGCEFLQIPFNLDRSGVKTGRFHNFATQQYCCFALGC